LQVQFDKERNRRRKRKGKVKRRRIRKKERLEELETSRTFLLLHDYKSIEFLMMCPSNTPNYRDTTMYFRS